MNIFKAKPDASNRTKNRCARGTLVKDELESSLKNPRILTGSWHGDLQNRECIMLHTLEKKENGEWIWAGWLPLDELEEVSS